MKLYKLPKSTIPFFPKGNTSHHTKAASPNHMLGTNSLKFYGWPAASSLRPA